MVPTLVLLVSMALFRALGALGIGLFASWRSAALYALVLMFLLTASAHFSRTKEDLIRMVPESFPHPRPIVAATGVLEILGAIGLLVPATRALAGLCLVLLMIAMFPANVQAARRGVALRGRPPTPLWVRLPMQLLFIGLTWWASRPAA